MIRIIKQPCVETFADEIHHFEMQRIQCVRFVVQIVTMKKLFVFIISLIVYSTILAQVTFISSNLPIVIINTNGQTIPDEPKITATMGIIDNGVGKRNAINDPFNVYNGKIGIEVRGHSSQMFAKKQYGIELRDNSGNSVNASLLGMPEESDWVLNASFLDKTFLRNVLAYKLGNDMGRYASRTRFCEVVLNNQYMGVFILQEKIKRDKNRVNIKKLESTDISGDVLTGGYIFQIDRVDPGVKYFNSVFPSVYPKTPKQASPISYIYVYPNAADILPVQQNYIQNHITQFETSLSKTTYMDPFLGYYNYIDMDAFVDYFLITEFTKTVDAYRLSAYMYKNRDSEGGKLAFGPMWDYDLAFGNANYENGYPSSGWQANTSPFEGIWSTPFWVQKIFNDPIFGNKLAKRWNKLKQTVFNLDGIMKYLDQTIIDISEARSRNFIKWPIIGTRQWVEYYIGQSYEDEILYLKGWIIHRYDWMNSNLPEVYSDVEWLPVDFSKIKLQTGRTNKLPILLFGKSSQNISSIEFVSQNPNLNVKLEGDSVLISGNTNGSYVFKGIAKRNNVVVSISPEYKIDLVTGIDDNATVPKTFELIQNFPNPFNPNTVIKYQIPSAEFVSLKVFDELGKEVVTLVNEFKHPGSYSADFSGIKLNLSTGVYFYSLKAGSFSQTKKMLLVK
jgi:hypothetical protein